MQLTQGEQPNEDPGNEADLRHGGLLLLISVERLVHDISETALLIDFACVYYLV